MKRLLAMTGVIAAIALGSSVFTAYGSKDDTQDVNVDKVADAAASVEKEAADTGIRALEWTDLSPPLSPEAKSAAVELNYRIDQMSDDEISKAMAAIDREGDVLVSELDDTNVSLEGYLVPLDFDAKEVSEFVLVPYFGACIHVPPPPPNQIVYVNFRKGLAMSEFEEKMYYPFRVDGRIKAARATTELAEVGYQLTASDITVNEIE